jgi:hypothetical protein
MYPSISSKRQSEMSPAPTVDRTNLDFVSAFKVLNKHYQDLISKEDDDVVYIISNMRQSDLSQTKSFDKEIIKLEKIINILKIYNESFELTLRKFIRVMLG